MRGLPAARKAAAGGFLGVLKSWLQPRTLEFPPPPAGSFFGPTQGPDHFFTGSVRVLVVDDEPVNLMMISAQMEALGLSPLLVADGAEAVALACELHFDLILMDLNMPDLDGLQATAAIRQFEASHRQAAVPVVAYSSRALSAGELQANGLNGSLPKPCPAWALDDCLRQWCPSLGAAGRNPVHRGTDGSAAMR